MSDKSSPVQRKTAPDHFQNYKKVWKQNIKKREEAHRFWTVYFENYVLRIQS